MRSSAIKNYLFLNIFFRGPDRQFSNYLICKTEQLHEASWGNVGVKFNTFLLCEAVSATVSLIPGWKRRGPAEEGGSDFRLYRPTFNNKWKFELPYLRNFHFGDTKYELYTAYVSGKYLKNNLPLLGAEFYQNSADQFKPFLTRASEDSCQVQLRCYPSKRNCFGLLWRLQQ